MDRIIFKPGAALTAKANRVCESLEHLICTFLAKSKTSLHTRDSRDWNYARRLLKYGSKHQFLKLESMFYGGIEQSVKW